MRKVFEYYLNNCHRAIIHQNELLFEFVDDFYIAFSFDRIDGDEFEDEYYYYNPIEKLSEIEILLEKIIQFKAMTLNGSEYLGGREDITLGKSITNEMYLWIKKINSFRKNIILDYYIDIKFGNDIMCPDEGNYKFTIEISEELWSNIELAKCLIESNIDIIDVPKFYNMFFRKNNPIRDNKSLQILTTNTKVRRIGYYKILSTFLKENKKVPATSINKKFESYSLNYKGTLEENLFNKGLISETKTGISAKPYIDTAESLKLLNKINNMFYPGKPFKVYQTLQSQFSKSKNIFELSDFDKLFFLECILRNDYFYFKSLLELLFIEGNTIYSALVKAFQNQLLYRLENHKQSNSYGDRKLLNNIDTILKRIKNWEKPEVYLEHIIMPRLNWMLDFGIVRGANNEFEITEVGSKLFQHLCIWNDINTEEIISPDVFLDKFIVHLFDDCYKQNETINPKDAEIILEKVFKHIDESFNLFKTLAPNRVTASQAVNYTKYKLYLEDNIKVGYQYILGELSKKGQDRFIFKYQEQYQDGYIQKNI